MVNNAIEQGFNILSRLGRSLEILQPLIFYLLFNYLFRKSSILFVYFVSNNKGKTFDLRALIELNDPFAEFLIYITLSIKITTRERSGNVYNNNGAICVSEIIGG